jgi:hypothetical protein
LKAPLLKHNALSIKVAMGEARAGLASTLPTEGQIEAKLTEHSSPKVMAAVARMEPFTSDPAPV